MRCGNLCRRFRNRGFGRRFRRRCFGRRCFGRRGFAFGRGRLGLARLGGFFFAAALLAALLFLVRSPRFRRCGIDAIGMIGQHRDQTVDMFGRKLDLLTVELAGLIGLAVYIFRSIDRRAREVGNIFRMRHVDDVGADGATAHVGALLRSALVEHHDLHEVGLVGGVDRLRHAQRGRDPHQPVSRRGLDEFPDPVAVFLLDFEGLDRGAGERGDGLSLVAATEKMIFRHVKRERARSPTEQQGAADDENGLPGQPEFTQFGRQATAPS